MPVIAASHPPQRLRADQAGRQPANQPASPDVKIGANFAALVEDGSAFDPVELVPWVRLRCRRIFVYYSAQDRSSVDPGSGPVNDVRRRIRWPLIQWRVGKARSLRWHPSRRA
jgi:hypothetical protein